MPQHQPHLRPFRLRQLALFSVSLLWVVAAMSLAARAARGFAIRFRLSDGFPLLNAMCFLLLLVIGFVLLEMIASRSQPHQPTLRQTIGLSRRSSARIESATGAAIGWGVILLSVLTMAIAGTLHIRFWFEPRSFALAVLNLVTIAVFALASEIAYRGYPYRRLIEAIGPTSATIVMVVLFAIVASFNQDSTYLSTTNTILLGLLLSIAWQRTHGLWLGWGMRFAWMASLGVLFGLPVNGFDDLSSVVQTRAIGSLWLTGGDFGPEGALLTMLLLAAAMVVLMKATRDWAWDFTHAPIISGGYPMEVAPPPAHAAMETTAIGPPPLIQILPTTPQTRSVEPDFR